MQPDWFLQRRTCAANQNGTGSTRHLYFYLSGESGAMDVDVQAEVEVEVPSGTVSEMVVPTA